MEKTDQELLSRIVTSDSRLKKLYFEHLKLEREVERLQRYEGYSASAGIRSKQLKKEKLRGMEHIMSILKEYRRGDSASAVT